MTLDEMIALVSEDLYEGGWCQRTNERVQSWRHTSDGGFNPAAYRTVPLGWKPARDFMIAHHYSGSYASMKLRYGLVEVATDRLVGAATFGPPQSAGVITNPLPDLDVTTAAEWNRLVLLDEVPANAESHFGGAALRDAYQQGVQAVVTFADPVPRPNGMPGHAGIVYQALNFHYCGRSTAGPMLVLPDNTVLTRRVVQKVRAWERGSGGVVRRFVAAGAPEPEPGEDGKAYLRRARAAVQPRTVEHPGNHRFIALLGPERHTRKITLGDGYEPRRYPKKADPAPIY